eukprot:TRINITY_DN20743_c0_g2_i1.p1 TRINITY_DN20743_c0_g2~~TRINITY_DN20743_c0_g2_i1.p1  ORF type:complete len:534 (+),score=60.91 TRINITY_DN20743_c0_g2_i1:136-1737(+)
MHGGVLDEPEVVKGADDHISDTQETKIVPKKAEYEKRSASDIEQKALMHLAADFVDLAIFFVWGFFYYPQIHETDQFSFLIICGSLGGCGTVLLLKGAIEAIMASLSINFTSRDGITFALCVWTVLVGIASWIWFDAIDQSVRMLLTLTWFDGGLSDAERESGLIPEEEILPAAMSRFTFWYLHGFVFLIVLPAGLVAQAKQCAALRERAARLEEARSDAQVPDVLSGCAAFLKYVPLFVPMGALFWAVIYVPWVWKMPFHCHVPAERSVHQLLETFDLQDVPQFPHPLQVALCWSLPGKALMCVAGTVVPFDLAGRRVNLGHAEFCIWEGVMTTAAERTLMCTMNAIQVWLYQSLLWQPVVYAFLLVCFFELVLVAWAVIPMLRRLPKKSSEHARALDQAVAKHVYFEILYDFVQIGVQAWILKQVQLKKNHEHFMGKLLVDFANLLSTALDLLLLKGPEALLEADGIEGLIELARNATKTALIKSRVDAKDPDEAEHLRAISSPPIGRSTALETTEQESRQDPLTTASEAA